MSYIFETGTFKIQQWDLGRHDFLESAPGLGMFVTVTTYNDEVKHTFCLATEIFYFLRSHVSRTPTNFTSPHSAHYPAFHF